MCIRNQSGRRQIKNWRAQNWTRELCNVEVVTGSVNDTRSWSEDPRLASLNGIFHLAAEIRHTRDPQAAGAMLKTNVEGLLNMIRLAARHRCRLIFISTSGTVGCFRRPEKWADEESPYALDQVGSHLGAASHDERRALGGAAQG